MVELKWETFFHNTGEGAISPHHLKPGGDLVWQVGTGYFGCRNKKGEFCEEIFHEAASDDQVKMIELKLSQGAKPAHGGILPAKKITPEIARIRVCKWEKILFLLPTIVHFKHLVVFCTLYKN